MIITAQHFVERIEQNDVYIYDIQGGESTPRSDIDAVALAMPRRSLDTLYHDVIANEPRGLRSGGALAPRSIEAIIYAAKQFTRTI